MKKYTTIAFIALAMAVTYGAGTVLAQDTQAPAEEAAPADQAAPKPIGITVTGVNYCLLSTLAPKQAADANPNYSMLNALKVTEAKDIEGNPITDLAGKTLHYLPTKSAEPVLVGDQNQGKTVEIIGQWYKDASSLLVETLTVQGGGGDEWDELPVGPMSGLQML